jgi:hypothetical protein
MVRWFVNGATRLLSIELNYTGQFAKYLAAEARPPVDSVAYKRAGARPFGIDEIAEVIRRRFESQEVQS